MVFLDVLALAYQTAHHSDDAFKTWRELFEVASAAGFTLAVADASYAMADSYKAKKDYANAALYFSRAAKAWAVGGNDQRRIDALMAEGSLFFQQGQKDKAIEVDQELLPLAKSTKNVGLQFIVDLAIAECLDGTDRWDRVAEVLKDAESLVSSEITVPGVDPGLVVPFFLRVASLNERDNNLSRQLVALEKALSPAIALATSPTQTRNIKPLESLLLQLDTLISKNKIRQLGEKAYAAGNFREALLFFELVQHFDDVSAGWKGKYEEYSKGLLNDAKYANFFQLPFTIISQSDGATVLSDNVEQMGPIAERLRLPSLFALAHYYVLQQRPDMVVKFVREALPYLKLGDNDTPHTWDVTMACDLAYSLMLQKDFKSAVMGLTPCLNGATKLQDAEVLKHAHQVNVWVLEAAGEQRKAQESIQFLLTQTPDDPYDYVQLAQFRNQQGDRAGATAAWTKAVDLYEGRADWSGAAAAHLALADSVGMTRDTSRDKQLTEIEIGLALYQKLGNLEGQSKAEASLGTYFAGAAEVTKAQVHFTKALKLAASAKSSTTEALILSQVGQAYRSTGSSSQAVEYFKKSASLYDHLGDKVDQALQLKNVAMTLRNLNRPEEALQTALKAETIADNSGSWIARYWTRKELIDIYLMEGQYQAGLNASQEARQISDTANQPLNAALAALDGAVFLEVIGSWQEALDQINSAIPVLKSFNDVDNEFVAFNLLEGIYGSRESELKNLDKAVELYETAYGQLKNAFPERAASLNLDIVEIYWQMGRFKEAVVKGNEALDYYRKTKDEFGQAAALISIAEAQRDDGNVRGAAQSLKLSEPLVMRSTDFYTKGRFYYGQAGLLRKEGRFQEAIEQYEHVIRMLEQFKAISNATNRRLVAEKYSFIYDELIDTFYSLGATNKQSLQLSATKSLEYAELNKSRVLSDTWGQVFIDGLKRKVPVQLQERERALQMHQRSIQSDEVQKSVGLDESTIEAVGKEESEFVRSLREVSPAYAAARYPQAISLAQIPVHTGELLIEFKIMKGSALVWMVQGSPSGGHLAAFYKVERPREWFQKLILSLRDAFNSGHPEQFDPKVSEELFNTLFPSPFDALLKTAQSVTFVPDDILFLLPFEILSPSASKGDFALLKTPTSYFPSATLFQLSRAANHARTSWAEQFIGIADPITSPEDERYVTTMILAKAKSEKNEDRVSETSAVRGMSVDKLSSRGLTFERLPNSATEVQNIARLFPGGTSTAEVRTGVDATKYILIQTDLARFRFVHFATHGILPVEARIKEPALVLSYDGTNKDAMFLTLSEVFELRLQADLVVLSACNTGSGKVTRAEGVASLGTAFLAAGASSATVSLWNVSDNSTALLMADFYRNMLTGMPKAASLAAARSSLVAQGYDNPFFWAPFILTGE